MFKALIVLSLFIGPATYAGPLSKCVLSLSLNFKDKWAPKYVSKKVANNQIANTFAKDKVPRAYKLTNRHNNKYSNIVGQMLDGAFNIKSSNDYGSMTKASASYQDYKIGWAAYLVPVDFVNIVSEVIEDQSVIAKRYSSPIFGRHLYNLSRFVKKDIVDSDGVSTENTDNFDLIKNRVKQLRNRKADMHAQR